MAKNQPEFLLQKSLCRWLNLQHPNLLYLSDTIASIALTAPQKVRNKSIQKDGFKTPDLIILQPNETYHGLLIELKIKSPFKLNGELKSDEHLIEQQKTINDLKERGYYACFCWSFEIATTTIDYYLNNRLS
jgi:hypothetical protein